MAIPDFLRGLPVHSLPLLLLSAGACGGSVVLDDPSGTGGTGAGGQGGTTTTTSQGGVAQGGATYSVGGDEFVCPPEAGYTVCANGICADLLNDPSNCGACGVICSNGGACQYGSCVVPPGCLTCAEFISASGGTLCPSSEDLYNELASCVCSGPCVYQCSDNACAGASPNADCMTCIQDTVAGCGNEFNQCANDI